jgi:hypothetical protein
MRLAPPDFLKKSDGDCAAEIIIQKIETILRTVKNRKE